MRKARLRQPKPASVVSITSATEGLTEEQSGRARRYFISMMIRTACFILTVLLPSPYRWIALVGAVGLPYVAVVIANAGRETISGKNAVLSSKFTAKLNQRAIAAGKDQSKDPA